MSEPVAVPGARDVRGVLDAPASERGSDSRHAADACVVACPPHPRHGGTRSDRRLTAVSAALREREVACLRFDYGEWDEGNGEQTDAERALAWARERFDRVGLFGYSFGTTVGLRAAAAVDARPDAVSLLAPDAAALDGEGVDGVTCPIQVVYGERDDTVDWHPVVEWARERGHATEGLAADHHFVGRADAVAATVAPFLAAELSASDG